MHELERVKLHRELLLRLWYEALKSPVGIFIRIGDPQDKRLLMNQLYRERQSGGTAELEDVTICWPKIEDQLWLVRKEILDPSYAPKTE